MTKYFKPSEFKCCCGNCFDVMNQELLFKLDFARDYAKIPFNITSSWRCEKKNKEAGGKSNSAHLRGNAVDIACNNSADRLNLIKSLIHVGFTRIGVGNTFIHVDNDKSLPENVMWTY